MRVLLILLIVAVSNRIGAERLPNIVLLIGDDHGYPYFGFMGDENVVTPSMDALADGGYVFTQGHITAPYCRPSLRTLITGLHPVQYAKRKSQIVAEARAADTDYESRSDRDQRIWQFIAEADALRQFDTLPKWLGDQGYVSWEGGKWWERTYENGHFTEGMSTGWDLSKFGTDQFFYELWGADGEDFVRKTMDPLFDFIDRNQDRPFFVWYGAALPHVPLDAPYQYQKYYRHKDLSRSAKLYYANITWWDDGVGRLMDHIQKRGLVDNTLYIYVSDNGWEQPPQAEYKENPEGVYNDPPYGSGGLKGKGAAYDLSFRTPIIFYWDDHIGASFNETSLISSVDIVPTILDIVGIEPPADLPGRSLQPLLKGQTIDERDMLIGYSDRKRSPLKETLYSEPANVFYLRTHRWHFIWHEDEGRSELFDITVDPFANNDLVGDYPELAQNFLKRIQQWQTEMGIEGRVRLD